MLAHKVMPGNRPSTSILAPRLTPSVIGQLIALYEHQVFVEGVIWGINPFDQWGVELGKTQAKALLGTITQADAPASDDDSSTNELVAWYRSHRGRAV
ncbi:Glucose-6-phosphate isomerase [Gordonia sp. YY1]|nr:Glucose-6-phosphate isomerase [Gordonia sp. YY1]